MLKYRIDKAFKPLFLLLSLAVLTSGKCVWLQTILKKLLMIPQKQKRHTRPHAEGTHAEESHDSHGGEFNAGEMIMHHVTDAHDIHLMDVGGHPVSIPLPIILLSTEGVDVFSCHRLFITDIQSTMATF